MMTMAATAMVLPYLLVQPRRRRSLRSGALRSPCNIDYDDDMNCDVGTPPLSLGPQPQENRDGIG